MIGIAAVRTLIAALVTTTVGASSKVYDYQRYLQSEAELESTLAQGGRLRFWLVTLSPDDPSAAMRKPSRQEFTTYRFALYGFMAVDDADATEKTFITEVESLITAFRNNKPGIAGTVFDSQVIDTAPLQWKRFEHRTFAKVLCHFAHLEIEILEQTE